MAKTLRTDSFYANLVAAIAVEDDNSTVKDFCGNQTVTLDTGVAAASGQFGYGVATSTAGGDYSPRGISLSPGLTQPSAGSGTVVVILNSVTTVKDQGYFVESTSTDFFRLRFAGSPTFYPRLYWGSTLEHTSAKAGNIGGMFAFSWDYPNDTQAFWEANASDTFPSVANYTGSRTTGAENPTITRIGGTGLGSIAANVFAYLQFSTVLTQAQLEEIFDSLSNDGSLSIFETASGPTLTSPTGTATGTTTATIGATTDTATGTLYGFVSTSATPPSATDLKAGTGATWSGSVAVSSTGAKTLSATGLTAGTGYYAHLIQTDGSANDSSIVTSAQFTTDALTKKLKLLAHADAQGDSGVAGAVWSAPAGSNITGPTKYGEFTGATFEAALEGGKAVLKVPVADFGGSALTTSDTPVALVRNATNTTGIISCTVIEE